MGAGRPHRRRLIAAFALAAVVTAQHVIAQQKTPKKAIYTITTKDISVGLSANSSIPQTLGYWKAEGLDLEITTLEGSTAGVQQLAAGNIQFATVGPETALIAREKGVKIKAFYAISRVTIFRVVVPAESSLRSVADLRGKTIGVSALTSGAVPVARALLASGGVDPDKDVKRQLPSRSPRRAWTRWPSGATFKPASRTAVCSSVRSQHPS
ncbi:MAG: hypothetical protein DMD87_15915 [Candidatus Rokuibacteriota bacterium]|nr:MAG: hypothetical protein DMD87_15915 [Candidatus Rokubacteria bacterium]